MGVDATLAPNPGGRLRDAVTAAETALRYEPDYAAALLAQGRVLMATNRPSDALPVLAGPRT